MDRDTSEKWFESEESQRLLPFIGFSTGPAPVEAPIVPPEHPLPPAAQVFQRVSRGETSPTGLIRFASIGDVLRDVPEEPPWNVASFVGPGVVTLLAGLPKAGKSTLVFAMLAALEHREPFLGEPVIPTRALLLTEERHASLAEKQATFGISDDGLHVGMLHTFTGMLWEEVIEQAVAHSLEHSLGLLIIDSFDKWTLADENSAQEVVAAMRPLMGAASEGLAVIVVHHSRKQKGRHATGVRGSTAFTGAVDVVAELDHGPDDVGGRVLRFTSRFAGAPEPLSVTLDTPEGRVEAGDLSAAMAQAERDTVLSAVTEEWQGWKPIAETVQIRSSRVRAYLAMLVDAGAIERVGSGKKGDPHRFRVPPGRPPTEKADTHLAITFGEPEIRVPAPGHAPSDGAKDPAAALTEGTRSERAE